MLCLGQDNFELIFTLCWLFIIFAVILAALNSVRVLLNLAVTLPCKSDIVVEGTAALHVGLSIIKVLKVRLTHCRMLICVIERAPAPYRATLRILVRRGGTFVAFAPMVGRPFGGSFRDIALH